MSISFDQIEFLWEQAAFPIALVSNEGRYLKVNPAFLRLFGFEQESEVLCRTALELTHPEDREVTARHREELLEGVSTRVKVEKRYVAKDGSVIWAHTLVTPVRDGAGKVQYFMIQIQDVSEIHAVQVSMVQGAKMVALGEMAAGLAHEINNPLTIIKGYADLIQHQIQAGRPDISEIERHSGQIRDTTDRVHRIIQALRRFSREPEDFSREPQALRSLVEDALAMGQERFRAHGIRVEVEGSVSELVLCNGVALTQVLMNLLSNSWYAVKELPERWIRIRLGSDPGQARLTVTDSGPGIPAAVLERIFQPFFTTKPPGEGTGLGLSVSKGIVESMGGRLRHVPGPNTCFEVSLPLASAANPPA